MNKHTWAVNKNINDTNIMWCSTCGILMITTPERKTTADKQEQKYLLTTQYVVGTGQIMYGSFIDKCVAPIDWIQRTISLEARIVALEAKTTWQEPCQSCNRPINMQAPPPHGEHMADCPYLLWWKKYDAGKQP